MRTHYLFNGRQRTTTHGGKTSPHRSEPPPSLPRLSQHKEEQSTLLTFEHAYATYPAQLSLRNCGAQHVSHEDSRTAPTRAVRHQSRTAPLGTGLVGETHADRACRANTEPRALRHHGKTYNMSSQFKVRKKTCYRNFKMCEVGSDDDGAFKYCSRPRRRGHRAVVWAAGVPTLHVAEYEWRKY